MTNTPHSTDVCFYSGAGVRWLGVFEVQVLLGGNKASDFCWESLGEELCFLEDFWR